MGTCRPQPQFGRTFYKGCSVTALLVLIIALRRGIGLFGPADTPDVGKHSLDVYQLGDQHSALAGRLVRDILGSTRSVECREVHGEEDKCEFVTEQESCQKDEGFPALDYNTFIYCDVGEALGMTILIFWWLWLFIGLAVCADDFFCPSLVVISDTLHLSPNVAGVTFLAFGNGAPDLFSAIAALSSNAENPEMGIAGLFGAGTFVTTVVVGTIALIKPFKAMERPFLRDVIFYMFLVYWVFIILWRGKVYLWEAVGFILLYCFYVVVVVVSGSIYKRMAEKDKGEVDVDKPANIDLSAATYKNVAMDTTLSTVTNETGDTTLATISYDSGFANGALETEEDLKVRKISLEVMDHPDHSELELTEVKGTENNNKEVDPVDPTTIQNGDMSALQTALGVPETGSNAPSEQDDGPPPPPWKGFLMALNPIDVDEWPEMRWYFRIYEVVKCPLVFIISLTCPVVNYDVPETHNWNRWMQCMQLIVGPTLCLFLIQFGDAWIDDVFPVWGITLLTGFAFAVLVWFTSENYKKPVYHWAFAYWQFLVAIIWIYIIANEIVALLSTFGVVFNISDAILGLTLLAWGNSIGDWIADSLMARQGFARMGFAACYGAPFFNLSLGFGIPYVIQMASDGTSEINLRMSSVLLILSIFLLGALCSSLLLLLVRWFKLDKFTGLYLVIYYLVFLTFALLAETNVILEGWEPW